MQFPYSWLKTWANPNLSADELAHLLTMSGLEVEEQSTVAPAFSGVVVAEVKAVEKHPDADRLRVTQVDAGTGELIQIVCGAPNVAVGVKVPCALAGAVLPGHFKIKPTKMRGQVSNGMLCSATELGLPEDVDGLLLLPADAPVGEDIRRYLDLDDAVFTLKITPNRADCLSIKGIAREVKALTDCTATPQDVPSMPVSSDKTFPTRIQAAQDCGRLLSRVIEGVDARAATPLWMRQRLERCGIRSISVLVDIGNYVMLELGQPMHVFDLDKLSGSLNARRATSGETLACLNGKTVTLSDNTLLIADDERALSIAGMMGGEYSAVNDDTTNILLESAFFTPNAIAGKARQYGFGSDSSFRFERGVDYALQEEAVERASALIVGLCGGRCAPINHATGDLPAAREVNIRLARAEKVLGVALQADQVETILHNLGLQPQKTADGFTVTEPSFRFDIEIEADIIEEIARVYGYENIPSDAPQGALEMIKLPETQKARYDIYRALAARAYREVINYAFVDEAWERDFADNHRPIRLQNPLAAQMSVMRSTLIGGLIDTLHGNLNRKQSRVRVFEIARVFSHAAQGYAQNERVGLLAYGNAQPEQWGTPNRRVDFYDVKADIEALLSAPAEFIAQAHPALHPGRAAAILIDGKQIGFIGELHPRWVQQYELGQAPIVAELELSALLQREKTSYRSVSKFPPVRRDLAFVLPENITAAALLACLREVKHQTVQDITVFDQYRGQGLPEHHKSLAVRIMLRSDDKTLQDEEVDALTAKLIDVAAAIGAKLRA
ncbi:MAG: phenylalanine--tRNA ligase subunit beta [Neisseria sp.]|nr:phenylalanine--tRNA ligase subunit beta [Neisseria sp.]